MEDAGLKSTLEKLLAEMSACSSENGWFLPWSESEMACQSPLAISGPEPFVRACWESMALSPLFWESAYYWSSCGAAPRVGPNGASHEP